MGQQGCDGDGWPATCRMLASAAPPIQGNNQLMWIVQEGGDKREGQFGGIESQKGVKVELIEWRSIDLHSINSKSTFHSPQSDKRTGTYSACNLGVRLRYQRHGEHGLKAQSGTNVFKIGQYRQKGGLPHVAFTSFFVMF